MPTITNEKTSRMFKWGQFPLLKESVKEYMEDRFHGNVKFLFPNQSIGPNLGPAGQLSCRVDTDGKFIASAEISYESMFDKVDGNAVPKESVYFCIWYASGHSMEMDVVEIPGQHEPVCDILRMQWIGTTWEGRVSYFGTPYVLKIN